MPWRVTCQGPGKKEGAVVRRQKEQNGELRSSGRRRGTVYPKMRETNESSESLLSKIEVTKPPLTCTWRSESTLGIDSITGTSWVEGRGSVNQLWATIEDPRSWEETRTCRVWVVGWLTDTQTEDGVSSLISVSDVDWKSVTIETVLRTRTVYYP